MADNNIGDAPFYELYKRVRAQQAATPDLGFQGAIIPGLGRDLGLQSQTDQAREMLTPEVVELTGLTPEAIASKNPWNKGHIKKIIDDEVAAAGSKALSFQLERQNRRQDTNYELDNRSRMLHEGFDFQDKQQQQQFAQENSLIDKKLTAEKDILKMSGGTLEGKKQLARMQMKDNILQGLIGRKYI